MRIIPVLDLKGGQAVHAVAGDRAHYRPLRSVFAATPDPVALARGLRDQFGATEVYVADLDAIVERVEPAHAIFEAVANLGLTVWADAGIEDQAGVARLIEAGVARMVAGLETVRGPMALAAIVAAAGPARVVFSLDLRDGVPIVARGSAWPGDPAGEAIGAGVRSIIRLDLATVGTGRGVLHVPPAPTSGPAVKWITGGGVASAADLASLERLGYSAALVGSAVHDGRILATDGTRTKRGSETSSDRM